ncbi:tyrosyl-DNA phosphodiesterase [Pseudomassariella vexata]|uniref:Tyrosyl-DNA phosphodiesterase n=1 Tax=Pseudomassariella vexata TaxID=1141098 RepID=A0A1Y2E2L0_9PEZI|nr:tyrosyl-DNA phosphodiesterase [Pseudomassariella vexata]ORY65556.1 tyrosyl-DNA phosphodiesterase [Pseudomassariella vexata]
MAEPPAKCRRLSGGQAGAIPHRTLASLTHPISPPRKKTVAAVPNRKLLPSPFRLTTIRDLSPAANVGAVSLNDLLGDPLISECWEFNYLHDIDFLMNQFDEDTRTLVKVHVVHGFWKHDDANRQDQAAQYDNVNLHVAFMPEMFGTHHTKMMVLFRHDDTAQVIIHTANMIAKDWTNMTNAVWQSPSLPRLSLGIHESAAERIEIGSGVKFKADLLSYLRAYNTKRSICTPLVDELTKFDFSAVCGSLVASVPGRHDVEDNPNQTRWGWAALKQALRTVPVQPGKSGVVVQVSSIATLGATDSWLQRTLFNSLSPLKSTPEPEFKVVFPTADEIRRSLDGYASGGSIHTKIQSAQQQKQLEYLRPMFCHWANDTERGIDTDPRGVRRDAGRQRAAPHIKTYIRYGEKSIDWALLTSANISKQAWGEAATGSGQLRISSWEIGVLVWPALLANDPKAKMVGTFKTNWPAEEQLDEGGPIVGLRVPYNLPLRSYDQSEEPWVATATYTEPDWQGNTWEPGQG